ncbi:mitochondrial inner membrane protein COX18 [Ditylenchus destructor]|nr:mitochondrial inner membrane protein COX18 [Ditylenchus destructor]
MNALGSLRLCARHLRLFSSARRIQTASSHVTPLIETMYGDVPSVIRPIVQHFSDAYITQFTESGIIDLASTLGSVGMAPTISFVIAGFIIRAAAFPLYAYSDKLVAERAAKIDDISYNVMKKVADHCNIKLIRNESEQCWVLLTSNTKLLQQTRDMVVNNVAIYANQNGLQRPRILSLRLLPIPLWIFSMFAVRGAASGTPSYFDSSFLWIDSLVAPDPYYVFPIIVGSLMILQFYLSRLAQPSSNMRTLLNVKRFYMAHLGILIPISVYILTILPACVSMYWSSFALTGIIQILLLRQKKVKEFFGIKHFQR